jgi:hypothetical protein
LEFWARLHFQFHDMKNVVLGKSFTMPPMNRR